MPFLKLNQLRSRHGFTLLEIMVALSIIAIVLVSVYKLHAQSIAMNNSAKFYTTAPFLAQRVVTDIETSALSVPTLSTGDFGNEYPGYAWEVLREDLDTEYLGEVAQRLKKLDVTISFNENEQIYKLRFYTYLRD
jgi:general secretion pathway protein I